MQKGTTKVQVKGSFNMSKQDLTGVYQLANGFWAYRYAIVLNGKRKEKRKLETNKDYLLRPLTKQQEQEAYQFHKSKQKPCCHHTKKSLAEL